MLALREADDPCWRVTKPSYTLPSWRFLREIARTLLKLEVYSHRAASLSGGVSYGLWKVLESLSSPKHEPTFHCRSAAKGILGLADSLRKRLQGITKTKVLGSGVGHRIGLPSAEASLFVGAIRQASRKGIAGDLPKRSKVVVWRKGEVYSLPSETQNVGGSSACCSVLGNREEQGGTP